MTSVVKSPDTAATPWKRFVLSGDINWCFHATPAKAEPDFGKPQMYRTEVEITENSELWIDKKAAAPKGDIEAIVRALKGIHVDVKEKRDDPSRRFVKFQSKVVIPDDNLALYNAIMDPHRPEVRDAQGKPWDHNVLVGNGSFGKVKGSLRDYTDSRVAKGRRKVLPTFEAMQVDTLVEYIRKDDGSEDDDNPFP